MLGRLREILLGNWKNKGVALIFASTIWYVAYQSELREESLKVRVKLNPAREDRVLVDSLVRLGENETAPFTGDLTLFVTGTRKEIDKFKEILPGILQIELKAMTEEGFQSGVHRFTSEDLSFLGFTLAQVARFEPEQVEFHIDDLKEKMEKVVLEVPPRLGQVTETQLATPSEVKLVGPGSLLESANVVAKVEFPLSQSEFKGKVSIRVDPPTLEGYDLTSLIRVEGPKEVEATVRMAVKESVFDNKSVRLRFLLPPVKFPIEIQFTERTIPLLFKGPEREIERLKQDIQKPDFFVAVPVLEAGLSSEKEYGFTFTEQDLILKGFSDEIEISQHPDRVNQGPWSCTIRPVQQAKE